MNTAKSLSAEGICSGKRQKTRKQLWDGLEQRYGGSHSGSISSQTGMKHSEQALRHGIDAVQSKKKKEKEEKLILRNETHMHVLVPAFRVVPYRC